MGTCALNRERRGQNMSWRRLLRRETLTLLVGVDAAYMTFQVLATLEALVATRHLARVIAEVL
jgi:hypothetical protein